MMTTIDLLRRVQTSQEYDFPQLRWDVEVYLGDVVVGPCVPFLRNMLIQMMRTPTKTKPLKSFFPP